MLTSNMLTANSVVCLSDKQQSMNMFQGTDSITFIQDFFRLGKKGQGSCEDGWRCIG